MSIDTLFSAMHISASGMRAQRIRQDVITSNLANAETTRTPEGGPYRRQFVVFEADTAERIRTKVSVNGLAGETTDPRHLSIEERRMALQELDVGRGVRVAEIRKDSTEPLMKYDPGHPDANEGGYVAMPNVSVVQEMAVMISATRAYEANVTAFNAAKQMMMEALSI